MSGSRSIPDTPTPPKGPRRSGGRTGPKTTGTKNAARATAREKIEADRHRARQQARRRMQILTVVGLVVVAAIAGIVVQSLRNKPVSAAGKSTQPPHATTTGGIRVGAAAAPVTVDMYEDFRCPNCRTFEESTGSTITKLRDAGKIAVVYHPMSFLDDNLGGTYSKRAANAAACADAQGKLPALHDALYKTQPAEDRSGGWDDPKILSLAKAAGVSGSAFTTCVKNQTYKGWVARVEESSSKAGVTATPTVRIAGKPLTVLTPEGFTAAVNAAAKK